MHHQHPEDTISGQCAPPTEAAAEAAGNSPAPEVRTGEPGLTGIQQLVQHQNEFIRSFQAGSYFKGTEKIKISWSIDQFAEANNLDILDPAISQRCAQFLHDARDDFKKILTHIRKAPVWWETHGSGTSFPRVVLKHLPLRCDFVIPATSEAGSTNYPSAIFRVRGDEISRPEPQA